MLADPADSSGMTDTTTTVRRAGPQDAETLSRLNADVQAIHAAALPQRFKPPGPDTFPPAAAAALIAQPANVVFIAEVDGHPADYAYVEIVRRPETAMTHAVEMIYLHHISVRPAHRRRGIGASLLDAVRSCAREHTIDRIALDVWTFNEDARAFFRRHGFVPYNERLWNEANGSSER
jgi:ribosomal protein S18 acetylase RimI-like enzyme